MRFSIEAQSEYSLGLVQILREALQRVAAPYSSHNRACAPPHCGTNVASTSAWCRTHRSGLCGLCHSVCVCGSFLQLRQCGRSARRSTAHTAHRCPLALPTVRSHHSLSVALPLDRRRIPPSAHSCAALQPLPSQLPSLSAPCAVAVLSFRIELRCSVHFSTRLLPLHALGRRGTSLLRPADYGDASQLVMVRLDHC